jgi:hypothetical protein
MGAFISEEDANKYDAAYTEIYADKLIADAPPSDKEEKIPTTVDKFADYTEDFEDYSDGEKLANVGTMGLSDKFVISLGTMESTTKLENEDLMLGLSYDAIKYIERAKQGSSYTLSFDIKNTNTRDNFAGLMINFGEENNESGRFYENNGLIADGQGSIVGNSGIGVMFMDGSNVRIFIITCKDDGTFGYVSCDIDTGIDFSTEVRNFTVIDDGKGSITLKSGDTLIATVTYADDKLLPAKVVKYCEKYYRTASISDANGNVLVSTTDALIATTKSFGFGGRAHLILVDDITIKGN